MSRGFTTQESAGLGFLVLRFFAILELLKPCIPQMLFRESMIHFIYIHQLLKQLITFKAHFYFTFSPPPASSNTPYLPIFKVKVLPFFGLQ